MLLKDKVAIITGAASGIGKATAITFGREGSKVMCADINAEGAEATARQIADTGGDAASVRVDVTEEDQVREMIARTVARWGRLDALFNNAGVFTVFPTAQFPVEEWDRMMSINLRGVFLGTKHAVPEMMKSGGGAIVNTASIAGLMGSAMATAYSTSKGGVVLLTKATAMEYARLGIRINCVCPGIIRTPIADPFVAQAQAAGTPPEETWARLAASHPMGRVGNPEEVADAVAFLCSGRASFITGVALSVDGGMAAGFVPAEAR